MTDIAPSHLSHSASRTTVSGRSRGPDRAPMPTMRSEQLLGDQRAVTIEHAGTHYVLRATRNGKLILTK